MVFGSTKHKYHTKKKIGRDQLRQWMDTNQIRLPESFMRFLTEIGNGGAGPYYGIYDIEKALSNTEKKALVLDCILYPGMPKTEWKAIVDPIINYNNISDDQYDSIINKIMGGMLCIGTQGCDYDMYIVLEGKYQGRVVYTADIYEDYPFVFTYEDNFLDWYERWLDEILLGYNDSWFGYKMAGNDKELIEVYKNSTNEDVKFEALDGMLKLRKLSSTTIGFLKDLVKQKENYEKALQLLYKYTHRYGKNYVLKMLESENEEDIQIALKVLQGFGRIKNRKRFVKVILEDLTRIQYPETLIYAGAVLERNCKMKFEYYVPFLCHTDREIRLAAINATRYMDKANNLAAVIKILTDSDKEVVRRSLMNWGVIPDERLLSYYKAIWCDYKDDNTFADKFLESLKTLKLPEDYFDIGN